MVNGEVPEDYLDISRKSMAVNIDELIMKIEDFDVNFLTQANLTVIEQEMIIDALSLYKEMNY